MNLKKNPFDREFELAAKRNYTHYAHSISSINPNSPLNTPSIPIDGPQLDSAIPTAQIIYPPITAEVDTSKVLKDINKSSNKETSDKRSNVVSVICHPGFTFSEDNNRTDQLTVRSAPILLDSSCEKPPEIDKASLRSCRKLSKDSVCHSTNEDSRVLEATVVPTITSEKLNAINTTDSLLTNITQQSLSSLVKILPKPTEESNINIIALSSLPITKKREKSFEEMVIEIKEREAALPPKAKPGRKSKSSNGVGVVKEEKRKLSLERNRAAAMRCRLKKKKEIDELKSKVDKYENQNKELKVTYNVFPPFRI